MAKAKGSKYNYEGFGEAGNLQALSPLAFQRTDGDSVDSIHDIRPEGDELTDSNLPRDTAGFIPKCSKGK